MNKEVDFKEASNENLLTDYDVTQDMYLNGWGHPARIAGKRLPLLREEILRRMNLEI